MRVDEMGSTVDKVGIFLLFYILLFIFYFGPLRSAEIFWEIRKYYMFRSIYSKQF